MAVRIQRGAAVAEHAQRITPQIGVAGGERHAAVGREAPDDQGVHAQVLEQQAEAGVVERGASFAPIGRARTASASPPGNSMSLMTSIKRTATGDRSGALPYRSAARERLALEMG
jgi:hypothetical protein